jgi:hypothetical protein
LNEHFGGFMSLEAYSKGGKAAHEEKDELGRSIHGVKSAERLHKEKDDLGRSVHGVKSAEILNKEKDDLGRSVNAMKAHEEKDDLGRSIVAVKGATTTHKEKDERGRSVQGVKNGKTSCAQKWKDPKHPELGEHNPGNLTQMQRRRGYPHGKENRVKVG